MKEIFAKIFTADNVRTLFMLVSVVCVGLWLKFESRKQTDKIESKLGSRIDEIGNRMTGVEVKVGSLEARIAEVKTELIDRITGVETKLGERISEVDRRVDSVKTELIDRITGVETKLGERISEVDRRVDSVKTELIEHISDLDRSIDGRVEAIVERQQESFYVKLKANDFAHVSSDFANLNNSLQRLTYVLHRDNGLLDDGQRQFITSPIGGKNPGGQASS